jgi:hypothetical protein
MRTFDVIFGVHGEPQSVFEANLPMWEARRRAMSLLRAESDACEAAGHSEAAERFGALYEDFQLSGAGALLDGYVRPYDGLDGNRRFIGIVEHGCDYLDATRVMPPLMSGDRAKIIAEKMAKAALGAVRSDAA